MFGGRGVKGLEYGAGGILKQSLGLISLFAIVFIFFNKFVMIETD